MDGDSIISMVYVTGESKPVPINTKRLHGIKAVTMGGYRRRQRRPRLSEVGGRKRLKKSNDEPVLPDDVIIVP
jgi:hypothetical protein